MFRRRIILLTLVFFLAVITASWMMLRNNEPSYNGKTLTQWGQLWIPDDEKPNVAQRLEAEAAIRHIGTNALPFALTWIAHDYDPPSGKLHEFLMKVPWYFQYYDARRIRENEKVLAAILSFATLGPLAKPVAPRLTDLIEHSSNKNIRIQAFVGLAAMSEDRLPLFQKVLSDPKDEFCHLAVFLLMDLPIGLDFATNGAALLPQLAALSTNSKIDLARYAISVMGQTRENPALVIPALTNALTSTNEMIRREAVRALGLYADKASNVVPALRLMLDDPNATVRESATNALQQILPP